MHCRKLERQKR